MTDLDDTIFAYDYRARLACTMTSRQIVRHVVDVVSENCARVYGPKSWRMLVAHDGRKQKSYRLNRPLHSPSIVTVYLVLFQTESLSNAILVL